MKRVKAILLLTNNAIYSYKLCLLKNNLARFLRISSSKELKENLLTVV
ncbi:hypothetical protein SAMN02746093_02937 [Legionella quinlivanii DSM 21216]|nr:hypothetical protein SAMN02746093_02937 [Legionella quinlivanii DSM 21216]STY11636.1 Uncharacterised protein [Legionella quinlivanii]